MNFYLFAISLLAFFNVSGNALSILPPTRPGWFVNEVGNATVKYEDQTESSTVPLRRIGDSLGVAITAQSAYVVDVVSGETLYTKNSDDMRSLASITKLVSLPIIIDHVTDTNAIVEIMAEDYENLGLNNFSIGERITVYNLMAAAMISSDNTALNALVRSTGMSHHEFVMSMRAYGASLGLQQAQFVEATGLHAANIAPASEIITLAQAAFEYELLRDLAAFERYTFTSVSGTTHTLISTNKLLGSMITVNAGKTGYVVQSGYNFVAEVERDGHRLLIVVLGSETSEDRFQDLKVLAHWTWENHIWPEVS